jgi:hypothetical protein
MVIAADRHAPLLHRLQQRRLRARAGAVDFVGHQQLAEHRARHEAEAAPPLVLVQHFAAENVGRHQIGRELHALFVQPQHATQRFNQRVLARPGTPTSSRGRRPAM